MWHLFTHTAGLTYGFHHAHPIDAMYRTAGYEWGTPPGLDLEACCDQWAELPLLFHPGTEWNYSVATDVLGRVVEVLSGQPLDQFLAERIFAPLGMTDTAFFADEADHGRLAALYAPGQDRKAVRIDAMGSAALTAVRPACRAVVASCRPRTTTTSSPRCCCAAASSAVPGSSARARSSYMASNHLPGGVDLEAFGRPLFAETTFDGVGFGLGVSVTIDPVKTRTPGSRGEFGWGGAASTAFWVDPAEDITAVFLTQLLPSSTHPIRPQLKQLVSQALVD